jgi:hypothetical protein
VFSISRAAAVKISRDNVRRNSDVVDVARARTKTAGMSVS